MCVCLCGCVYNWEFGVFYVLYFMSLRVSFRLLFRGEFRYRNDDVDAFFLYGYTILNYAVKLRLTLLCGCIYRRMHPSGIHY